MEYGNRLEDVELTDPKAMRALAHPVRLAILDRLRHHGPSTATELAPEVGATPSVTSWHLRHLASFGLVRDAEPGPDRRQRRWETVGRGFRFQAPEDPTDTEGRSAARTLSRHMFLRYAELPARWLADVEPHLDPVWQRASGLANTGVSVTAEELAAIEDGIEQVLAPYVTRAAAQRPAGARNVRLLRYALPDADHEPGEGTQPGSAEPTGSAEPAGSAEPPSGTP